MPKNAASLAWVAAVAIVAHLPNPAALVPGRTYYFRDFSAAFYPLRAFLARELSAGRVPFWNPYLHEGTFAIPVFYPLDMLPALWPGPSAVSWLLTAHFTVAALGMCWLARDLGLGRLGAFVAGAVYATGGLALSSLNLYVFLQALALAPFVVATLRRCALAGGRWTVAAAVALAASVSTLALEFVTQGVLLGLALAMAATWKSSIARRAVVRLGAALAVGAGLAAVPVAVVRGLLPETARGVGFVREEALRHAVAPVQLLQGLVAGVLGPPGALLSDGRVLLVLKGLPYFMTLYMGPFVLAAAVVGAAHPEMKKTVRLLIIAGLLGLWVALGAAGGLAPALLSLPPLQGFRYPSKALLLPYAALALLAGAGVDRMARGQGWRTLGAAAALATAVSLGAALAISAAGEAVARALGVAPSLLGFFLPSARAECLATALLAASACGLALAAARGAVRAGPAAALLSVMIVADLARAGAGVNPQDSVDRLALAPGIAAELRGPGRVFSYGVLSSPEFVRCATVRRRGIEAWSPWVSRQVLGPYTNVIDGIEGAETPDLTALGPRVPEPTLAELRPAAVAGLLPRLRQAAVTRVLSLDPLEHSGLRLRTRVPLGLEGLGVHVYEVADPLPREVLDCACRQSSVRRRDVSSDEVAFDVVADAPGRLIMRDRFARGWQAELDGAPVALGRHEASHRVVAVPAGRHQLVLRYVPPGLRAGLAVFAAAALCAIALLVRPLR